MYFVIFQFSIYTLAEKPDDDKGTEVHADRVFELANYWLTKLERGNTFKPKVLAKISLDNKHFIGSSIAVSHFLRPICLYNRIIRLKRTLRKKILHFAPLKLEKTGWIFKAFQQKKDDDEYRSEKDTCKNCKMIFLVNVGERDIPHFLEHAQSTVLLTSFFLLRKLHKIPMIKRTYPF